jgi:transposase
VRPATGDGFGLVLPAVSTEAMSAFLERFSASLAPHVHAVMVLDQAGWHGAKALAVPANVTLAPPPPYSPELNPVEWIWDWLRENDLSLRVFDDLDAVEEACCEAWNKLVADPARIRSLTHHPWLRNVSS